MGGELTIDYLAPSGSGENTLVRCERGDYAADAEIAQGVPRAPEFPKPLGKPEEVETPGVTTCEALAEFLGIDLAATTKAMPVTTEDGNVVLALVRGDDRLSESKLLTALKQGSRPSTDEEVRAAFGASGGSLGPVAFKGEVIADETLREGEFVTGANKDGFHLKGVAAGRDYEPRFADIREPIEGDRCPECGGALDFQTAIEVGHIFNFGDKYSAGLDATFLDDDGKEKPLFGGSYGIGPGRIIAAAIEQNHDEKGIAAWPKSITPYDVHIVTLPGLEEQAEALEQRLEAEGAEVLLDDRELRAGEKFADADLIGCPYRITVGKKTLEDGAVDVLVRQTGEEQRVQLEEVTV
jgi:prolyl-tRNA synthetase